MGRGHIVGASLLAALSLGTVPAFAAGGQSGRCHLGNQIQHVVYLQFDNVHLRRDNGVFFHS